MFLGLLLYNTVGFVFNFYCVLADLRHEMRVFLKEKPNENDLTRFVFKQTDFEASTDEFSKDHKFYDVVKTEILGDSIVVYCFDDEKETQLAAQFNDTLFQNTTSKGDFQRKIKTIFKHLINEYIGGNRFCLQLCPPSVLSGRKSILGYQTPYFLDSDLDIITPPPQFIG